jgi:hypothetical protein
LKLRVEGEAVNDPYVRYYGLGIDQPLDRAFWSTQPHKVRDTVVGYFVDELDIPDTTTYVMVGISAYQGYWTIRVYVNDKLIGEKNCAIPDAYPGSPGYPRFDVAVPSGAKAYIWAFRLDCKQPDGTWKTYTRAAARSRYDITAEAVPGTGNLRFKIGYLHVLNDGDEAAYCFARVFDDTGKTLWSRTEYLEPGQIFYNTEEIVFDMPNRNYTLTFQAGHDTTVDDVLTLTVKPLAAGVVITAGTVLASLMIFGSTLALMLLERKFKI